MTDLAQRFQSVTQKIEAAARAAQRDSSSVHLLAVSKTFEASQVEAIFHKGQRAFGENYVQEAVVKIDALKHHKPQINWHLIGPLQSNKTAVVAEHFDWVQTIDRFKIAQRLNDQRPAHLPALNVCIQVNVDGGMTKSGVDCTASPEAALALACQMRGLERLVLRGLLAIPEPELDIAKQQAVFAKVKAVFDFLNANLDASHQLDTLSMGMSADFAAAIAAGSTMVRVGSAIFGERQYAA
jgi:pyridoxal phosphate enzyme (YggS family)